MQISIQSLEVTYNKMPYRFIVKKVFNTSRNEISFHCWAPEDNMQAKELMKNDVLFFEWDHQKSDLSTNSDSPVSETIRQAIKANFSLERAQKYLSVFPLKYQTRKIASNKKKKINPADTIALKRKR